jgi:hypothetical protein
MSALAATGAGFLIAVLWFDLMFDVQVRRHSAGPVPPEVLASISGYYRRVTTEARPMGRLITLVMLATLGAIAAEIVTRSASPWIAWPSFGLGLAAIGTASVRTVPNAVRLGAAQDDAEVQARLARSIYRDHRVFLAAIAAVAALQLSVHI